MHPPYTLNEADAELELALDILCDFCTALFDENSSWVGHEYRRHHDFKALTQSAETGCHLCSLILSQVSAEDIACLEHEFDETSVSPPSQIGISIRGFPTITLWAATSNSTLNRGERDNCENSWTDLARLHVRGRKEDYGSTERSSASENFSESSIAKVSCWIEKCQKEHAHCREAQAVAATQKMLPTRLLDLGSALETGQIKLCSSHSFGPNLRYSTLSHCWGGECEVKLVADNLATFQQGIAVNSLPETFKDAVYVTRRLGLYYLWIDALW